MSAQRFGSMQDFLSHSSRAGGSGRFHEGWKKKGKLYAWLHTLQLPIGLWVHNWPQLMVRENKETRKITRNVWGQSENCHETEEVLKRQYFRDKSTGQRDEIPCRCPGCRFIEWCAQSVLQGELAWTDPVLRYEGADNPKENRIVYAGGICGFFSDKKLTEDKKDELKKAGIYVSDAWQQNAMAKLNYVFTIVDNDDVGKGVQITTETQQLGEQVKGVINDALESLGVEAGDPQQNPYCIEFIYKEDAPINDKYKARRIERIKMTPEIEKLLRGDPPNLDHVVAPFNMKIFRARLEKHLVVECPLDQICDVEEAGDTSGDFPPREEEKPEPEAPKSTARKTKQAPKIAPEDLGDPCLKCDAPMAKTATKCDACGTEYEEDGEEEEEEKPAPPPPKKTAAAATKSSKAKKGLF